MGVLALIARQRSGRVEGRMKGNVGLEGREEVEGWRSGEEVEGGTLQKLGRATSNGIPCGTSRITYQSWRPSPKISGLKPPTPLPLVCPYREKPSETETRYR